MGALAADRNTPRRDGKVYVFSVGAAKKLYAGGIVFLNAGNAQAATAAAGLVAVGVAEEQVDNTLGSAGDLKVKVRAGVFRFANSASGDAITDVHIGQLAFVVDDQTVARTDNAGARSAAGRIVDVDAIGVWVEIGPDVSGLKEARGQRTQVAASDTVATGLSIVVAVVASFDTGPTVKQLFLAASIGNQSGAPAAGSILLKTFKPTAVNDVTPVAATDFTDNLKINWVAYGY